MLLIPTTLMGGTLPVLTAFLSRRAALFGENFGLLYSLNTAGAVLGVMLSGFVTIGLLGERATTVIAALANVGVGVTALIVARRLVAPPAAGASASSSGIHRGYSDSLRQAVLVGFALSGFTALAYEIIWTRQLILFLRTSVYAFSGMLAVFLIGIGAGSLLVSPRGGPLAFTVACIRDTRAGGGRRVGGDPPALRPAGWAGRISMAGDLRPLSATVVLVLPLTLLFGMIAPVAAVCYVGSRDDTGGAIGRIYAANTVGSILGALATGFLLLPRFGATSTVMGLAAVNLAIGMGFLALERSVATGRRIAIAVPAVLVLLLTAAVGDEGSVSRRDLESRIGRRLGESCLIRYSAPSIPAHLLPPRQGGDGYSI